VELIGTIVRLQVQRSSLKLGERPRRWFDPAPLTPVPALVVGATGVWGLPDGNEPIVDVHNREHPDSHFSGQNGISVGFTSHYTSMRDQFGPGVPDGIAGENVIVWTDRAFRADDLPLSLAIEGADGLVHLDGSKVIEPCVEFSRFVLGRTGPPGPDQAGPDAALTATLAFLRHGTRGYCAAYTRGATVLRLGDRLFAV
jgi:hypothetical protein